MLCMDFFRKTDWHCMVVTTRECMQVMSVQDAWLFLPLFLEYQIAVCVH
jgi:hypothetical protein